MGWSGPPVCKPWWWRNGASAFKMSPHVVMLSVSADAIFMDSDEDENSMDSSNMFEQIATINISVVRAIYSYSCNTA